MTSPIFNFVSFLDLAHVSEAFEDGRVEGGQEMQDTLARKVDQRGVGPLLVDLKVGPLFSVL